MRRAAPLLACLAGLAALPAAAESCRRTEAEAPRAGPGTPCPPERRVEPYDPDRVAAGRSPGSFAVAPGTEVRIGGRVRAEFEGRR